MVVWKDMLQREILTATGQSGLATTRLLWRSGASSQHSSDDEESEITMRPQARWEWLSEDQNTAMRHVGKEEEKQSPRTGIERRAEDGISTIGAKFPKVWAST
jgi:hypothetical protein